VEALSFNTAACSDSKQLSQAKTMAGHTLKSTGKRQHSGASSLNDGVDEPRAKGVTELQGLLGFSRRQLITMFLLFNLIFWTVTVWLFLR
jgi:hypothetical protein